ncbi:imidazole glycerol phosphate synthase subunit HisH [Halioxenophilus sp. WMMB6]|uniref:imidazole glycerol phosphate synthase subunit HisH n=1 Tax=Halioxenophilus sp. WMMB6 TaxID=3073815 RepID=UPI00295EB859|nr:imidazole glycerol phosphate synthase subunit HisH [Halioxenophilus sp. WMMB6]
MATATVAICDYGMGNLHSVASALQHVAPDQKVLITADAEQISAAERVIFPGVGAIRDCMAEIRRLGFDQLVRSQIATGKPVLGICVGLQALLTHSEENGGVDCLDMIPGEVRFFGEDLRDAMGQPMKVPHMGWNNVYQTRPHALWDGIEDGERFYFVHSYCAQLSDSHYEIGRSNYGVDFSAAVAKDNLVAVQFHPEKSHRAGLQLLRNFCHWSG